ncbi:MAG: tight adherence protein [Chloroflexota bacterium]|jgi:tight adherence protein C|nr:tight adherence protein [Chloroflexota bacterium]
MLGALLVAGAVVFLLLAVAPRPRRLGPARGGLAFIRSSTLDAPAAPQPRGAVVHTLLRRLAARTGLGARWVTRQQLVEAGIDPEAVTPEEVTTLKALAAVLALAACLLAGAALPGALFLAPLAAWLAFIAPSVVIGRRRARRRAQVLAELPDLVGLLRAFINAQVPLEQALHLISRQVAEADPENILAGELRVALGDYGLGQTIDESLGAMADRLGIEQVRTLVTAIAQGKRLGTGMEMILRDQEMLVRMAQRNRATAAASQVSTRLMGVLVGVYLPEFVVLVMLPLFWGIMLRAFG